MYDPGLAPPAVFFEYRTSQPKPQKRYAASKIENIVHGLPVIRPEKVYLIINFRCYKNSLLMLILIFGLKTPE